MFTYPDTPRTEMLRFVPLIAQTVLDVGCARGAFGNALKSARPKVVVHGVEPDFSSKAVAQQRLDKVFHGLFPDALSMADNERILYDCIVFNDVLEHVTEPQMLLAATQRLLAPSGHVIASIPNVRFAPVVLSLLIRGRWEYTDQGVLDRTHLRFFTRKSIKDLFIDNGWVLADMTRLNVPGSRRFPFLARMLERIARDFSCPQFAVIATIQ